VLVGAEWDLVSVQDLERVTGERVSYNLLVDNT
jgi:hypothetical protein